MPPPKAVKHAEQGNLMEFELWFEHNGLERVLDIEKQTPLENLQTGLTGLHMHLASLAE